MNEVFDFCAGSGGGVRTLAQSAALQLVSFWAHAGELPWFVDTLILAHVTGVAALIDVCQGAAADIRADEHGTITSVM